LENTARGKENPLFLKIDHVAVIVPDLEEAILVYQNSFGVKIHTREINEEGGFEIASFQVGESHFEILSPIRSDSVISGILEKRGPGIHHIAMEVEEIEKSISDVKAKGLRLTSDVPRRGSDDTRITFIHPKSLFGTMLELVEVPNHHKE
jgi:methylmalonyl-CoA/ethylmalonyl-CoA epimerase